MEQIDMVAAKKIAAVDLSLIGKKLLMEKPDLFNDELIRITEVQYKRYWYLFKKFPNMKLTPTKMVDEFWHTHILFTKKYCDDCKSVFGYYVHHEPWVGERSDLKEKSIKEIEKVKKLYHDVFEEELVEYIKYN